MQEARSHTLSRSPRSFARPSALVLLAAPDVQLSNWAPQLGTCPRLWRGPGRGTAPPCGFGSPRTWGTCEARGVCGLIHLVGRAVAIKDARPLLPRVRYLSLRVLRPAVMTRGQMAAVACPQSRRPASCRRVQRVINGGPASGRDRKDGVDGLGTCCATHHHHDDSSPRITLSNSEVGSGAAESGDSAAGLG